MVRCPEDCIDIRPMKEWISETLPKSSELREVILQENDFVEKWLILGIGVVWMRLWKIERGKR